MDELLIPSDELHFVAKEFASASKESQVILDRLEKATNQLEGKWAGATRQVFYKHYVEWQIHMRNQASILNNIAQEIHGLAERFEKLDK